MPERPTVPTPVSALGARVGRYPLPSEAYLQAMLILIVLSGVAVLALFMLAGLIALSGEAGGTVLIGGVVLLLLAMPLRRVIRYVAGNLKPRVLSVYAGGVCLREGRTVQCHPWDTIATLTVHAAIIRQDYIPEDFRDEAGLRRVYHLRIATHAGDVITLETMVRQARSAIAATGRGLARARIDAAREALAAGETLRFGPVRMAADRLLYGEDVALRWYQIERVQADLSGDLTIRHPGLERERPVAPVRAVPNVHLLLLLLAHEVAVTDFAGRPVDPAAWTRPPG
jgi:hypothetical protein